nr:unnamed protein product [Haemonchus contortus]
MARQIAQENGYGCDGSLRGVEDVLRWNMRKRKSAQSMPRLIECRTWDTDTENEIRQQARQQISYFSPTEAPEDSTKDAHRPDIMSDELWKRYRVQHLHQDAHVHHAVT